jgi:hypothetical protein
MHLNLLHWQKYAIGREHADMNVEQDEASKVGIEAKQKRKKYELHNPV